MSAIAYTQTCEDRDFVDWHRGCPWCAVWVLWLQDAALLAQVQAVRGRLAPYVLPRYDRQPHVTLAYRGLMGGEPAHPAQEFGVQQLQADLSALQAAALAPFVIRVQGGGSFDTVPYLQVQADQGLEGDAEGDVLQRVHHVLQVGTPWPGWHYVPHVTLGHYAGEWPQSQVLDVLEQAVATCSPHTQHCDKLWLVRYASNDIAGPLQPEGYWDLRAQSYVRLPGALLQP